MQRAVAATVALALPSLLGCGGAPSSGSCDPAAPSAPAVSAARGALRGGGPEQFLALDADQQDAIVAVLVDRGPDATPRMCSGVLIAPDLVLSAKHCIEPRGVSPAVEVRFGPRMRVPGGVEPVSEVLEHPELDLCALRLAHDRAGDPAAGRTRPIPATATPLDQLEGTLAELAGYGVDDALESGTRAFAITEIAAVDPVHLRVQRFGRAGACAGDSGGPLLWRGEDGEVEVIGVLDDGSAACTGDDRYTRLDVARDWLEAVLIERQAPAPTSCERLGRAGRCSQGRALRCKQGAVVVERCEAGLVCGWNAARARHDCVAPEADRCDGAAEVGRCELDVAVGCAAGVAQRVDCSSCGQRCELSAFTGQPRCSEEQHED